jgi:hypothetical protein
MAAIRHQLLAEPERDLMQWVTNDNVLIRAHTNVCAPRKKDPRPWLALPLLHEAQLDLSRDIYTFSEPHRVQTDDGDILVIQTVRDQIVANAIFLILGPAFEPYRQFYTAGWRPELSDLDALEWVKELMLRADWFIRMDVKSCFESIRHDLIFRQLATFVWDRDLMYLIADLLASVETAPGIGIGRGTTLGPLLADIAFGAVDDYFAPQNPLHNATHPRIPANQQRLPATLLTCHHTTTDSYRQSQTAVCAPRDTHGQLVKKDARGKVSYGDTISNDPDVADTAYVPDMHSITSVRFPTLVADHGATRILAQPVSGPDSVFIRCYDDMLRLIAGDRKRLRAAREEMHQVLDHVGLASNPDKEDFGPVTEGFDLLGLHLRVVDGHVFVKISQDKLEKLLDEIDHEIDDAVDKGRGPRAALNELHQFAHNHYQFYKRAGADCSFIDRYVEMQYRDRAGQQF